MSGNFDRFSALRNVLSEIMDDEQLAGHDGAVQRHAVSAQTVQNGHIRASGVASLIGGHEGRMSNLAAAAEMAMAVRRLASGETDARRDLREATLTWIAADRRGQTAIHPLGFLHHEVATFGDRTLRLHIWPQDGMTGRRLANAHDHVWDLTSAVLMGQIANLTVEADTVNDPADATHELARVLYDGPKNTMKPTGEMVRVRLARRDVHVSGEAYTLPAGVLHDSEVAAGIETVTLVVADRGPHRESCRRWVHSNRSSYAVRLRQGLWSPPWPGWHATWISRPSGTHRPTLSGPDRRSQRRAGPDLPRTIASNAAACRS
jgi:hypothetical protein